MKAAYSLIKREIERLETKSIENIGLSLTLDEVRKLEILIKTKILLQESSVKDELISEDSSETTDEEILKTLWNNQQ